MGRTEVNLQTPIPTTALPPHPISNFLPLSCAVGRQSTLLPRPTPTPLTYARTLLGCDSALSYIVSFPFFPSPLLSAGKPAVIPPILEKKNEKKRKERSFCVPPPLPVIFINCPGKSCPPSVHLIPFLHSSLPAILLHPGVHVKVLLAFQSADVGGEFLAHILFDHQQPLAILITAFLLKYFLYKNPGYPPCRFSSFSIVSSADPLSFH